MNHSFKVEIAEKYGIEKAILLENFYYWVKKNEANKKNIHDGKAYTYNSAEAFEKLFPYMKARKIAQLLREMEKEDKLLISGQFGQYNRTKSYTLTDKALLLLGDSIIPKIDNGKSENSTIEKPEDVSCLNTDIKQTDEKQSDVNTDKSEKEPSPQTRILQAYDTCFKRLYSEGRVRTDKYMFDFGVVGKLIKGLLTQVSEEIIIQCIEKATEDEFYVSKGFPLTTILSKNCISSLMNAKGKTSKRFNDEISDEERLKGSDNDNLSY